MRTRSFFYIITGILLLLWSKQPVLARLLPNADCPTITNTETTTVAVCTGQPVTALRVNTTATTYKIEFVRFDAPQTNPYLSKEGIHLGEIIPDNGVAVQQFVDFPANTGQTDKIYYVYACLKPMPDDPACQPFALITVTVRPEPTATTSALGLACLNNGRAQLTGGSTIDNSTYAWSGPGIDATNQNEQNPVVSGAGTYSLIVTANGCISEPVAVTVLEDAQRPTVQLRSVNLLSCPTAVVPLSATIASFGASYTYQLTGNDPVSGVSSTSLSLPVSETGTYTLSVTALNGCTTSQTATVQQVTYSFAPSSFTLTAREPLCGPGGSAPTGQIGIVGFDPDWTYELSLTGQFTGRSTPMPADGILLGGMRSKGNPQTYTVRVYNETGCYSVKSTRLIHERCPCPAPKCLPIMITKVK
ncbi:hypothetical protein [Spirosoma montaniterrae]|uniref:Ig-like domain-containing protein n=1 Tax=Spirosoma montaniterrae TaxID=1178516 RepID=A0A1P9WZE1_9BACT|nr:hypothetical protein [Spirosoma montaniterrae]AQG80733.1 hypothetical protein AWR27_16235 [Spirosoma montaniterrae]